MIKDFGRIIRSIRTEKGIGLNTLAHKLDVSPAYLSNLENGKTETIQLTFLDRLQNELQITFFASGETDEHTSLPMNDLFQYRLEKAMEALQQLAKTNPTAAGYLLGQLEQGTNLFLQQAIMPNHEN